MSNLQLPLLLRLERWTKSSNVTPAQHLEPFFSRQGITRIESRVAAHVKKLDDRLIHLKATGTIVNADHFLCALTGDIICEVSSGTQAGLLDDVDFTPAWYVS